MCDLSFCLASSNFGMKFFCARGLGVVDHLFAHCRICSVVKPHFSIQGCKMAASSDVEGIDLQRKLIMTMIQTTVIHVETFP